MSFFGFKKKILMSCSAIQLTATQSISTTIVDISIFDTAIIHQVAAASSVGYPTISTTASQITLEAGWKYFIEVKSKVTDSIAPQGNDNFAYWLTNTSDTQFSSTGFSSTYRDTIPNRAQEACIAFVDATASSFVFKMKAQKTGSVGSTVEFNGSADSGNTNFKSHILIKAWR